jgi:ketosteroid isomerase-like protein
MENKKPAFEQWKAEVVSTEEAFAQMADEEGMTAAFLHFAAEDAVLQRGNTVIKGKNDIRTYLNQQTLQEVNLKWHPDFVEVAASGDLAYTYGKYTFSAVDTSGTPINANGIFHTVWKRQANGEWKYVWD